MNDKQIANKTLDACGWICPMPVLRARKVLLSMEKGQILDVHVTDDNAPKDLRLFCVEQGHEVISEQNISDEIKSIMVLRG